MPCSDGGQSELEKKQQEDATRLLCATLRHALGTGEKPDAKELWTWFKIHRGIDGPSAQMRGDMLEAWACKEDIDRAEAILKALEESE